MRFTGKCMLYSLCQLPTGTCFIQKIYATSSSLLQGKHLPFTPSPLRLNIFLLFVILYADPIISLRTLPRYFSFRLPHLNINIVPPSDERLKYYLRVSEMSLSCAFAGVRFYISPYSFSHAIDTFLHITLTLFDFAVDNIYR